MDAVVLHLSCRVQQNVNRKAQASNESIQDNEMVSVVFFTEHRGLVSAIIWKSWFQRSIFYSKNHECNNYA